MANRRKKVINRVLKNQKSQVKKTKQSDTEMMSIAEQSKIIARNADQTAASLEAQLVAQESIAEAAKKQVNAEKEANKVRQKSEKEQKKLNKSQKETTKYVSSFGAALQQVGRSGIPLMSELSDLIQNIGKDAGAAKLALTALGAAAGALATNYFGAEPQAATKAANDVKQRNIDAANAVGKIENKRDFLKARRALAIRQNSIDTANEVNRLNVEAGYASQRAAIEFGSTMKSNAAEFTAASKTAYFGNGIGSVGYAAGKMQLAGVGAENVAQALSAATKELGSRPTSEMAADMAVMATRTGASAENISSITSFFKRLDKVSGDTALNMVEGMRAMANSANIDLGGMMEEMANASKEALSYQIRSGTALAKQVAYASSIGVSFNDVAKAGKSMVLNYKDSIKNEMQLSAMLGRNVNLSEARALFAQGKTDEALQSIKGQGLDPTKMNMFQQEALSQALGGLDLNSLQKIATTNGKNVSATTGNVKAGNQGFLSRTEGAQSALAAQQANISAQQAIVDQKLSGQITEAYLNSKGYLQYQANLLTQEKRTEVLNAKEENRYTQSMGAISLAAKSAQLAIDRMFSENWRSALGGAIGAALATKLGSWIFGKSPVPVKVVGGADGLTDLISNKSGGNGPKIGSTSRNALKYISKSPVLRTLYKSSKVLSKGLKYAGPIAAVVGAGVDFMSRKNEGQSNLQAGAGTAGGLAGAWAGAEGGAAAGGAIGALFGGVGAVPGALIGGAIGGGLGYFAGSSIADFITGAGKDPKVNAAVAKVANGKVAGKSGGIAEPATMTLSDTQYQTRLQTEMVALLGLSTGFLKQLLEVSSAEFDRPVMINGTKLNSTLLASARKNYAVARNEKVGAYKAP